jgi:hypothetical protein
MTTSYIGFARDHSGSMRSIRAHAARDYNSTISGVREASVASGQTTIVSVVELGYGSTDLVRHVIRNQPVDTLTPIPEGAYSADGYGTPLWDAVGALIEDFEALPDYANPENAYLVMTTTDGGENASRKWNPSRIMQKMAQLVSTDRWTFVFRCPRSDVKVLLRAGVPEGNILPWDQTAAGVQAASAATTAAFSDYMTSRSMGVKSTTRFYANMADVKVEDVKAVCTNIGAEVQFLPVGPTEHDTQIRDFIEARTGAKMLKGAAFYQLSKGELKVQGYKLIAIRNQKSGEVFAGPAARQLVGLPTFDAKLSPDNLGEFDVFIQSTSTNRKVVAGTSVMYWPNVGKSFKEGKSA